jgi:hypothetical protein
MRVDGSGQTQLTHDDEGGRLLPDVVAPELVSRLGVIAEDTASAA